MQESVLVDVRLINRFPYVDPLLSIQLPVGLPIRQHRVIFTGDGLLHFTKLDDDGVGCEYVLVHSGLRFFEFNGNIGATLEQAKDGPRQVSATVTTT